MFDLYEHGCLCPKCFIYYDWYALFEAPVISTPALPYSLSFLFLQQQQKMRIMTINPTTRQMGNATFSPKLSSSSSSKKTTGKKHDGINGKLEYCILKSDQISRLENLMYILSLNSQRVQQLVLLSVTLTRSGTGQGKNNQRYVSFVLSVVNSI